MRIKFIKWYNMLLTTIISMLGFGSCNNNDGSDDIPCEYGCPITEFKIGGTVTDTKGTPLEGIQVSVVMQPSPDVTDLPSLQTTTTLADGTFMTGKMDMTSLTEVSTKVKVKFDDIDGTANGGQFDSKTVSIAELKRKQTKNADGKWYQGEYEYSGDISLSSLSE